MVATPMVTTPGWWGLRRSSSALEARGRPAWPTATSQPAPAAETSPPGAVRDARCEAAPSDASADGDDQRDCADFSDMPSLLRSADSSDGSDTSDWSDTDDEAQADSATSAHVPTPSAGAGRPDAPAPDAPSPPCSPPPTSASAEPPLSEPPPPPAAADDVWSAAKLHEALNDPEVAEQLLKMAHEELAGRDDPALAARVGLRDLLSDPATADLVLRTAMPPPVTADECSRRSWPLRPFSQCRCVMRCASRAARDCPAMLDAHAARLRDLETQQEAAKVRPDRRRPGSSLRASRVRRRLSSGICLVFSRSTNTVECLQRLSASFAVKQEEPLFNYYGCTCCTQMHHSVNYSITLNAVCDPLSGSATNTRALDIYVTQTTRSEV